MPVQPDEKAERLRLMDVKPNVNAFAQDAAKKQQTTTTNQSSATNKTTASNLPLGELEPTEEEYNFNIKRVIGLTQIKATEFNIEFYLKDDQVTPFTYSYNSNTAKNKELIAFVEFMEQCLNSKQQSSGTATEASEDHQQHLFDVRFVHKNRLINLCEIQTHVWALATTERVWVYINGIKYLVDANNELNKLGNKMYREQNNDLAIKYYKKSIERFPRRLKAVSNIALVRLLLWGLLFILLTIACFFFFC